MRRGCLFETVSSLNGIRLDQLDYGKRCETLALLDENDACKSSIFLIPQIHGRQTAFIVPERKAQ